LRAADANYVKYHLFYNEANPADIFENKFDTHSRESREYIHSLPQGDLDKFLKALSEREIEFELKK
jgi:hypothetical protein